ncbi:MAG: hypothetical protein O2973_14320 [Gemmatimonadetes bacterium]|nr:hypothetical protein [Gemmatimonadota bacterium]
MGYADIKAVLGRGFSVSTLNEITRLGHDLLGSDATVRHPAAAYVLAATAQKIAWHLEGQPLRDDAAEIIEAHLGPKMEAVIKAADSDADALTSALDDLARAYSDTVSFLGSGVDGNQ